MMENSVFIDIGIDTVEEATEQPSKTYRLDLEKGRIVGIVDEQEAVKQAIRKAIITPRFKCLIYDDQYGSEIEDAVIAKDATQEYIEAVIPDFIKDCLKPDTRILDCFDFVFEIINDQAHIAFSCDTIYGLVSVEEVI